MTPHDMPLVLDESGHVPAADMARFIDGTCDRGARSRVTHHLADCEECREELTALRRLVSQRSRMTVRFGALLGAAAAVTLITLSWRGTLDTRTDELPPDSTRAQAAVAEIDAPLPVAFPATNALVPADSVRLTWHAAGVDAAYRIVLLDESGGIVFSDSTSDTSTIVPATAFSSRTAPVTEHREHTYHWSVEARLLDGRSATTGVHRFRVR